MRIKIKSFLICAVIFVICSAILSYGASFQPVTTTQTSYRPASVEDVISLYKELISLREHIVEESRKNMEIGRINISELVDNEIKAAEAKIQLAEFQGDKETVIEELKNLVQTITKTKQTIKWEIEVGARSRSWLYDVDSKLLELKIRLAKAKLEKPDIKTNSQTESELRLRLNAAKKINDLSMRNNALAGLAINASESALVEFTREALAQINDLALKNKTTRTCVINLSKAGKTEEALAITNMINDLQMKNEALMRIATGN